MLPISIAGSIRISCPSTVSPASTVRTSTSVNCEVAARLDAAQVRVGLVGAGDVAVAVQRRVHQDRDVGADRADVARRADPVRELRLVRGPEALAERVAELDVVDAVVAAHEHEPQLVLADDDRIGLDQRARGHAERLADLRDRGLARRGLLDRRVERAAAARPASASRSRPRRWRRSPAPARRRSRPRARRHVLVRAGAAHHPDVGVDPVPLQAAAVEDLVVGLAVLLVADVQARPRRGRRCRSPS